MASCIFIQLYWLCLNLKMKVIRSNENGMMLNCNYRQTDDQRHSYFYYSRFQFNRLRFQLVSS